MLFFCFFQVSFKNASSRIYSPGCSSPRTWVLPLIDTAERGAPSVPGLWEGRSLTGGHRLMLFYLLQPWRHKKGYLGWGELANTRSKTFPTPLSSESSENSSGFVAAALNSGWNKTHSLLEDNVSEDVLTWQAMFNPFSASTPMLYYLYLLCCRAWTSNSICFPFEKS